MPSMEYYKTVEEFFTKSPAWKKELKILRGLLLELGLKETVKWGGPVYCVNGKNVVAIGGFKSYFGLWFFQGALLADKAKVLINAQEGRTKALRQMRLASAAEVDSKLIKAYVKEAIGLAKKGIEIKAARNKPLVIPKELTAALARNKKANSAFSKLTTGKQREYAEYISAAKQDTTKQSRLEKILPMICDGFSLNDKYRRS